MNYDTLSRLLKIANDAYPEGLIARYFDLNTGDELPHADGDTLALFIGREIISSMDGDGSFEDERDNVLNSLTTAMHEMAFVIHALRYATAPHPARSRPLKSSGPIKPSKENRT